ncbi:hypothetical protein F5X99DRAFT_118818 [Biscogniauxia marginata]|nr:hypothetical protein F5X99DRAFT_118818 [Biscogniauxia marginata]
MSAYDYDGRPYDSRRYFEERRDRADPRYTETQETYYRVNPSSRTALVPRAREDSDISIEEVRRDFPPPGYSRDIRRARSAEPGHDEHYYDARRSYDSRDRHHGKKPASIYYEEEEERARKRVLSKQEKIIAAVAGGLLVAGAKEVWDRREAEKEGIEVQRNLAASAALGAAGALAGYQGADFYNKHALKEAKKSTYIVHKGRDGRVIEYYSDDDEDPKNRKGNKSFLENALSAAGLGGAIKALTGTEDKDRERDRDDRHYDSRSRHSSPDSYHSYHSGRSGRSARSHRSRDDPAKRMQKAAKASLVAGAAEAFRVSKEPGGWQGEKMKRVLTAAAGAAAVDAAHDPNKDGKRHLFESVVGGLLGNRMLNGSRKDIEEDRLTGRSRSRSRARSRSRSGSRGGGKSGLAALATAGLGAIGAKKYAESRSRSRSRRPSYDSYDSRSPSPRKHRSRSRSIVDGARRSLAKIGLGSGPDSKRDDDSYDDRSPRSSRHRSPDSRYSDDYTSRGYMRGGRGPEEDSEYDDDRSAGGRSRSVSRSRGRSSSVSSSDLGDSDDDKKRTSKMRRKQLITTGLAAIATIHAAHGVYGSIEARSKRHKAVKEGRLSPEENRKLKTKAIMQDAASIGVAALGIKGAFSELKEARSQAHEIAEWKEERQKRHARRIERLKRANSSHHGRSRAENWSTSGPPQLSRYDEGPRYSDGNPYSAALPAPPMSYDRR